MQSHYKTLGLTNAASIAEIRRAYRILARRYHPDVNPNKNTESLFKEIANAYAVLSDPEKRKQYDIDLAQSIESFEETFKRAEEALKRSQRAAAYARGSARSQTEKQRQNQTKNQTYTKPPQKPSATSPEEPLKGPKVATRQSPRAKKSALRNWLETPTVSRLTTLSQSAISQLTKTLSTRHRGATAKTNTPVGALALVELSVSIEDAIRGVRKTVEIGESGDDSRKVSVTIPPGVRTGNIVRLRSKDTNQEIVVVIRVETHSWLSLGERGLTMEIPLTIGEAIEGGKVQVPSFGDPLLVTVEPRTQSGKEVRLKGQGLFHRDGSRGDLYIRFTVKIPDTPLPQTPSPREGRSITEALAQSYSRDIRAHLPKRLIG